MLFRQRDEPKTVGRVRHAFDQQVDVVGHEAVRNYRELLDRCSALDLPKYKINNIRTDEYTPPFVSAERQEISIEAAIVE
jgi:hypothetical protein